MKQIFDIDYQSHVNVILCKLHMASKNFDAFILILLFCILTYTHKYNYDTI